MDSVGIIAMVNSWLIALDKCSSVCPIGVVEVA